MTTTISFATSDGHLRSSSSSYSTAQSGSNLTVFGSEVNVRVGQDKVSTTYYTHEGFFAFPYTLDAQSLVVTAYFDLYVSAAPSPGTARNLGIRHYDWGTLTTGDWQTPTQITAMTRYGYTGGVNGAGSKHTYSTEGPLNNWLNTDTGTKQVIVYNDRMTAGDVPTTTEYNDFASIEVGGTAQDPALVYTSVALHTLVRVANCQVQLSNGDHVYIEASTGGNSPVLTLKRYDGSTHTTIASNLLSGARDMGSSSQSLQQYTLVRDASDNIYWLGHAAGDGNALNAVAWKKTGTNTWTEQPFRQAGMPASAGNSIINNIGAAWHNVGTNGTLMVLVSRDCTSTDASPSGEISYALVNCQHLLSGSGSMLRASGDAFDAGLITPWSAAGDWNQPLNPVGTSLDVVALPNSTTRGVVVSLDRASKIGDYAPVGIVRYILNSTGTAISQANAANQDLYSTKDAGAKVRVLPISDSRFAVVTVDKDAGWGPTIYVIQNIGTSGTFSTLGSVLLGGESITTLPAPSAMHDKTNWDALYHPAANEIYVYYFDTANALRLMRTTFNLATYQAVRDEIQVQATVGVAGNTNHAVRVDRGALTESEALVCVATKTSGNAQSTVYIRDPLNVAPLAPTLVDKANYDATSGAVFDWIFNDLNVGDTQSAYELEIDNADTLANVVDTGKVTSTTSERNVTGGTLSNGVNYRWRVRTWDATDVVGAWSGYDFFSTSSGGSVNITNPATDNPGGYIYDDVLVQWAVDAPFVQASYRVRLVNNLSGAEISDTGFITSTATSHQLTGLASDVEHRIEVTARNASSVSTNTATRLLTPNYDEPELPTVIVTAMNDDGYILIDVVNPVPQGDRPEVTTNQIQRRQSGDSTWTTIATVAHNGSYKDWHTGSGVEYEYRVVSVASIGSVTSEVQTVTLQLMGVWLHVPADPEATARNYMFGANQRGATHTSYSELTRYAGREDPVADFAHYHDQTFNVVIDIPFGEDYHSQIDGLHELESAHSVLVYRDNRRRNAFGILNGGFSESDQPWGLQVSFDFTKVHYNEEVV